MRLGIYDQQAALSFMIQQASYIETQVYQIQYPEIQYPQLIPVDESAPNWSKSVTFYSQDKSGEADWFQHLATNMRLADVSRAKFEQPIEMAGIGYRYTLEELGEAQLLNRNLTTDKADAARRAAEEFIDRVALQGDTPKGWEGLFNNGDVTAANAPNGAGGTPDWASKTSDEIIADVNNTLAGIYSSSLQVEMADTVLLPVTQYTLIAGKPRSTTSDVTVLDWITRFNVFTSTTGRPLLVRAARGLETAGAGATARMVCYRRDPQVLKLHIPMRHMFLPVWQTTPLAFDVPGIMRIGGTEIRRPGAVRYIDAI